jgi:integrase/recombinase XerD
MQRAEISVWPEVGLNWSNLCNARRCRADYRIRKERPNASIALPATLWAELLALRGEARAEDPVFPSRGGKQLDRGRVRLIVRRAAKRADVDGPLSPHWLRHAHASHSLDHGPPIHLVQATLGHSSVATTSAYLHARPADSSARFISLKESAADSSRIALPLSPTRAAIAGFVTL